MAGLPDGSGAAAAEQRSSSQPTYQGSSTTTTMSSSSAGVWPTPTSSHPPDQPGPASHAGTAADAPSGHDSPPSSSSSGALVAGLAAPMQQLRELVGWPLAYQAEAQQLGLRWPRGVLLHGPPGCGKTLMVRAIAEEFGASLHVVIPGAVFGSYLGESERRLREAFQAAAAEAAAGQLVLLFLDEVDALCPRREGQKQHEARVVAQLLTLLDGAAGTESAAAAAAGGAGGPGGRPSAGRQGRVVVVAATNRPNALDPALRRPGRLDREVWVPVPDAAAREEILRFHTKQLPLSPGVDLKQLAGSCHGYSGADLAALAREAAMHAFSLAAERHTAAAGGSDQQQEEELGQVTPADFAAAMQHVGPSIVRGAAIEVQRVRWGDVGGYEDLKQRLQQAVLWPLQHADAFRRLGLSPPRGVLLHGPPGCSKTLMARAAATESKATFLSLSCAQLYSMYVGDGEAALRDTFHRARLAAPAILFLDEVDALLPAREAAAAGGGGGGGGEGGGPEAGMRLLSTLLTEMDGMEQGSLEAPGVLVLAATNRPAALDAALLRPGRLDVLLYVPPPDREARWAVLQLHTKGMPLASDVDLGQLADGTLNFTGAELAALCREAALAALREDIDGAQEVAARHFLAARLAMSPALTPDVLDKYEAWGKKYSR